MKTRTSLVSNSSSSSFVCAICGEIESGMDLCPSEVDMTQCENDHYFHNECASKIKFEVPEKDETDEDDDESYDDGVPETHCPVCQLICLTDEDELKFLRKIHNTTKSESLVKIKETYGTYKNFQVSV